MSQGEKEIKYERQETTESNLSKCITLEDKLQMSKPFLRHLPKFTTNNSIMNSGIYVEYLNHFFYFGCI